MTRQPRSRVPRSSRGARTPSGEWARPSRARSLLRMGVPSRLASPRAIAVPSMRSRPSPKGGPPPRQRGCSRRRAATAATAASPLAPKSCRRPPSWDRRYSRWAEERRMGRLMVRAARAPARLHSSSTPACLRAWRPPPVQQPPRARVALRPPSVPRHHGATRRPRPSPRARPKLRPSRRDTLQQQGPTMRRESERRPPPASEPP